MLQQDIVSVGNENLSSSFEEQDEDDISSDEEDGCHEVRTITRESTRFMAETINNTSNIELDVFVKARMERL